MSNILLSTDEINLFHKLTQNQQEEFVRSAILGLGDPAKLNLQNGLIDTASLYESPHHEFIHYMSRPENFWFTCKWLLNINLHPFQLAILQELWQRKFPMLIASMVS